MTSDRKKELTKVISDLASLSEDLNLILEEETAERDSFPLDDDSEEVDIIEGNVGALEEAHERLLDALDELKPMIEDEE